jgi:hypothetical protein
MPERRIGIRPGKMAVESRYSLIVMSEHGKKREDY